MGSALRLWHLADASADEKPRVHAKLTGPANPATCLDVCCAGNYVIAVCADGAMQIDVFCSPTGPEEVPECQTPLAAAFVLSSHEQIQRARIVQPAAGTTGDASAAIVRTEVVGFGSSMVAFWILGAEQWSKALKGSTTLAAAFTVSADQLGGRVLCARGSAAPQESVIVAFGPLAKPAFAQVSAQAAKEEGVAIKPFGVSASARGNDATVGAKAGKSGAEVAAEVHRRPAVLGPLEAAVPRAPQKRKQSTQEDHGSTAKRAAMLPQGIREAAGGLSVAPVVRQGLRAKDGASITEVLKTSDHRVIDTTVAQLSGHEAFDLLQECAQRLLQKRVASHILCSWMQRVLLRHCAFISSRPILQRALQPLHDIFEARCSTYRSLVLLRGRMEIARDSGRQVLAKKKQERDTVRAPLLEYVEGDEDLAEEKNTSEGDAEAVEESAEEESAEALDSDEELMDEWLDLDGD